ncbi:MAG: hypothetical protein ABSF92_12720 [Candidatus Acidiferrales bacterium]|jgi:hypothetical protein
MIPKAEVLKELDVVTDRISTQVRTTAIAVLALTWGLLVGDSPTAKGIAVQLKPELVVLGAASVCVLFLDFLQYFAGYFSTKKLLEEMENTNAGEGEYNYASLYYRLRIFFFWAKQVFLIFTVVILLLVLGHWVLSFHQ